ncbi:MAG: BolA family transcriptional regulator [Myxococcota bacterium]|nr:BolA family transcriptional regulator [Myxococcota bacterium]MDW8361105.1 BolA family protein [Myxococcales bacterium]
MNVAIVVDAAGLEARLRAGIEGVVHVAVEDLTGGGDHFRATVVAAAFRGKSRLERHRMVYDALGELMRGPVHALALETRAPDEVPAPKE